MMQRYDDFSIPYFHKLRHDFHFLHKSFFSYLIYAYLCSQKAKI